MNNEQLARQLQQDTATFERDRVPAFATVFSAAEMRVANARRRRYAGGLVAAAAVIAIVASLGPATEPDWQYVDPVLFASTTSWEAPSDVLLPQHSVDLFEDIPVLIEGTKIDGGALL
jgi:hypothetical protein